MCQIGKPFGIVTTRGQSNEVVPWDSPILIDSAQVAPCARVWHILAVIPELELTTTTLNLIQLQI